MTQGVHPFPSRTRKLRPVVPKILGWWRPGKIGRCQHLYSSIAQSVVRMYTKVPNTIAELCVWNLNSRLHRTLCSVGVRLTRLTTSEIAHRFHKIRYSSIAQSVEHSAVIRVVVGSSPTGGAKETEQFRWNSRLFCFLYFIGFYNSVKCFKCIFHSRLVSFLSLQYDRILVLPPLLLYVIK